VITQAERIRALEVEVRDLKEAIGSMEGKLDDLLALKNKGAGVFWLFSAILGSGIIGVGLTIVDWFKHG
jgi:hypothetical protein